MITLYTNHCPKCKIVKSKLDAKYVEYNIVDDISVLIEKQLDRMPALEVDGRIMDSLIDINDYINAL